MKYLNAMRSLIVPLTVVCLASAVIAFLMPHGFGSVFAACTIVSACLIGVLCLVCAVLMTAEKHHHHTAA